VESVGKTTLASQSENPIILDVEGGSAHIDVPRLEVQTWAEIEGAIAELVSQHHDFKTVIVDSMDWAEKLAIEDMLKLDKKNSIEDYGFGKGYTQSAERISRFLASLDRLIQRGMSVILIAHAKVTRFEPPDGLQAYDRYELKMTRQTSPLVKEWCDSLLFANFKTRVVEAESGKAKGLGGKERVILTTRSAAHDAKCRVPGIPEEIPMTWQAVARIVGGNDGHAELPLVREIDVELVGTNAASPIENAVPDITPEMIHAFLVARDIIKPDQTLADVPEYYIGRVRLSPSRFAATVAEWHQEGMVLK
jgi:hypothetical protein